MGAKRDRFAFTELESGAVELLECANVLRNGEYRDPRAPHTGHSVPPGHPIWAEM